MRTFFEYNWQIRDEWFQWCEKLTAKELWEHIEDAGQIVLTIGIMMNFTLCMRR